MDLRLEFITRLRRGERMTDLCREFGISRKTGHKLKKRVAVLGVAGLEDRSRAPRLIPHRTAPEIAELILAARARHASWGPKKLKVVLEERLGRSFPSASTIGTLLARAGLVAHRRRRPGYQSQGTTLRAATVPNAVWCVDYKGQFRLGDGSYCYPLTVTDQFSRYLLGCEGMAAISDAQAREVFEALFQAYGLPEAIRSDNGIPFASTGLAGLTRLSAYWLYLGIALERSRRAHPEDNGAHERMHRTLKAATTRPARHNLLQQQERFNGFQEEFNRERPHEALNMQRPADLYTPSPRPYPTPLPVLSYPTHDDVIRVNRRGFLRLTGRREVYLTQALIGYDVGVREERDGRWLVTFAQLDLGHVQTDGTFIPTASPLQEAN